MTKKLIPIFITLGIFIILIGVAYAVSYLKVTISSNSAPSACVWATSTSPAATFATFDLKNPALSNENIIIDSLTINNIGTSATGTNVFHHFTLYDDQGHYITTSTQVNINTYSFNNLNFFIPPGWSRNFVLKGLASTGATPGQTVVISIPNTQAIVAHEQTSLDPVNVSGSFPINGNEFIFIPTPY